MFVLGDLRFFFISSSVYCGCFIAPIKNRVATKIQNKSKIAFNFHLIVHNRLLPAELEIS